MKRHPKDKSPDALVWAKRHRACPASIRWLEREEVESMAQAWALCKNGDWMLWILQRLMQTTIWANSPRYYHLHSLSVECMTQKFHIRRAGTIRRLIHAQYSEYYL